MLYYYSQNKGKLGIPDENGKMRFQSKIKMLICVTLYNEKKDYLKMTLAAIQSNLREFKKFGISNNEVLVVVIQDGIMNMDKSVKEFFWSMDKEKGIEEHASTVKNRTNLLEDEIFIYEQFK